MLERCDLLTLKEASEMILYSFSWVRLHCKDSDFPKMFHVFDARQKFIYRDDWIEYCEQHDIKIKGAWKK